MSAVLKVIPRRSLEVECPLDAVLVTLAALAADQRNYGKSRVDAACQFVKEARKRGLTQGEIARLHLEVRDMLPAEAGVPKDFSPRDFLTMVARSTAWPKALRLRAAHVLG